jgi:alkyl sulfatase BDS1-like metallo-beta-lactamase superfamily hydrolase
LTGRGRDLEPVLLALGRWGSPLRPRPDSAGELSPDALVVALRTTFDPDAAVGLHATVQLEFPGDAFVLTVHNEGLDAARGSGPADSVLAGSVRTIQDLVFDRRPLDDARRSGDARIDGDTVLLARFLAAFDDHRTR